MKQNISNLMDGELESHESGQAIQACCKDPDAMRVWDEYHLIGDVMRGDVPRALPFTGRVISDLSKEPTVLAPRRLPPMANIVRISLAAAASVATIGVVGWIGFQQGGIGSAGPTVVRGPAPVQGSLATVAVNEPTAAVATKAAATGAVVQPAPDIHDYLVAHRQTPSAEFYRPVAAKGP
ncbi:sigma-E factor negative regulatory protein [Usitatibacter palustris]|uniref:Anti sigma-E protein RseA N-terminal domain-containing protein n=1 Tax=Usitatibacter palustris TaxID=2732487 RepID=A0A6M4H705_9PROT|nr:sigma-E factor negative regulatory protein [Usitatibacter palustris]QJR15310.1 hypothetical protein DSM104440_02129 [Usitatibacter palustris]